MTRAPCTRRAVSGGGFAARTPTRWPNDRLDRRLQLRVDLTLDEIEIRSNPEKWPSGVLAATEAIREGIGIPKRQSKAMRELGGQQESRKERYRNTAFQALAAHRKLRGPDPSDHIAERLRSQPDDRGGSRRGDRSHLNILLREDI